MRIVFGILSLVVALWSGAAGAQERASREEALEFVQKAVNYIKANGKDKAMAEFNNPKGAFIDRDLYMVALDLNGKVLAHGANQRLVNKDLLEIKDADGKAFVREEIELVKTKGKGWVNFKFVNPVTKDVEPRSIYVTSMGDYFVGAGIFLK